MTTTRVDASGAGRRQVTLGGKTYKLAPLRNRDFAEFEKWMQDQAIEMVERSIQRQNLSFDERRILLNEAYEKARRLTFTSKEASPYLYKLEGAAKILWLSIRQEHPEITEEFLVDVVQDDETLNQLMGEWEKVQRTLSPISQKKSIKRNGATKKKRKERKTKTKRKG